MNLDILTFCSGCFKSLRHANSILKSDDSKRRLINKVLNKMGLKYNGSIEIYHGFEIILNKIGLNKIKELAKFSFKGFKIGSFHGCHLIRPSNIMKFDDPLKPRLLDDLIITLEGTPLDYVGKYDCCGGVLKNLYNEMSLELLKQKLFSLKELKADFVVVACPFCHYQFDLGQIELIKSNDIKFKIPILTFTDFIGLSLGFNYKELGLSTHIVKVKKMLDKFHQLNGISKNE